MTHNVCISGTLAAHGKGPRRLQNQGPGQLRSIVDATQITGRQKELHMKTYHISTYCIGGKILPRWILALNGQASWVASFVTFVVLVLVLKREQMPTNRRTCRF